MCNIDAGRLKCGSYNNKIDGGRKKKLNTKCLGRRLQNRVYCLTMRQIDKVNELVCLTD